MRLWAHSSRQAASGSTPTFESYATSTVRTTSLGSFSFTMPSGIQAGDTLVAFVFYSSPYSNPSYSLSPEWSTVAARQNVSSDIRGYYHVLTKTATGTDTLEISNSDNVFWTAHVVRISGTDADLVTGAASNIDVVTTSPATPSHASAPTGKPCIWLSTLMTGNGYFPGALSALPSGYTQIDNYNGTAAGFVSARKTGTTGTEPAAVFTTSPGSVFYAATVCVR